MISDVVSKAQTGDFLAVFGRGIYGWGIRAMLSRGLHRCFTNHNAPIWRLADTGVPVILQIERPTAHIIPLADYLESLIAKGGRFLLLRPDAYDKRNTEKQKKADAYMIEEWLAMDGSVYDVNAIKTIAKRIFRMVWRLPDNTKEHIYCTEGTLLPMLNNPHVPFRPDILVGEKYPAPIHAEHLIRSGRVRVIGGCPGLHADILAA